MTKRDKVGQVENGFSTPLRIYRIAERATPKFLAAGVSAEFRPKWYIKGLAAPG